jgi:meiotically up-regulated gene 157 (Mug157) protein
MDDANIPSLLSAPYLGYTDENDLDYQITRRFILSSDDPYYHKGKVAQGVGSEHIANGYIWPLALLMQGFTAVTNAERQQMLTQLLASDPGDHRLHESFDPDDASKYTRPDFGWPNALFAEFILTDFKGMTPLPVPSTSDLHPPRRMRM